MSANETANRSGGVSGKDLSPEGLSRAALGRELLRLMAQEGLQLTDDLNQCEAAIVGWIRQAGGAALEAQLGGKKAGLQGEQSGVRVRGQ